MKISDFKNLPALTGDRAYLVIAPGCWGRASTAAKALANAKKEHVPLYFGKWHAFRLYDAPADTTIDDMGYSRSSSDKDAVLLFERKAPEKAKK